MTQCKKFFHVYRLGTGRSWLQTSPWHFNALFEKTCEKIFAMLRWQFWEIRLRAASGHPHPPRVAWKVEFSVQTKNQIHHPTRVWWSSEMPYQPAKRRSEEIAMARKMLMIKYSKTFFHLSPYPGSVIKLSQFISPGPGEYDGEIGDYYTSLSFGDDPISFRENLIKFPFSIPPAPIA